MNDNDKKSAADLSAALISFTDYVLYLQRLSSVRIHVVIIDVVECYIECVGLIEVCARILVQSDLLEHEVNTIVCPLSLLLNERAGCKSVLNSVDDLVDVVGKN